jgi:hypothetical protein
MAMKFGAGRLVLVASILTLTAGCVPFPQRVRLTPLVTGKLEGGGGPAANRRVRVVVADAPNESCEGPSIQATTNEFGKFVLPPRHRMSWVLAMMAHRRFRWNLCVEDEYRWVFLKQHVDYTLVDTGPEWRAELRCSIAHRNETLVAQCNETHLWNSSKAEIEQWLKKP